MVDSASPAGRQVRYEVLTGRLGTYTCEQPVETSKVVLVHTEHIPQLTLVNDDDDHSNDDVDDDDDNHGRVNLLSKRVRFSRLLQQNVT